ncbi:hypothetical protein J1N35_033715 [Gossypium stocksii]|uniref:Transposase MuDR plant domain-containing protein n=1 Tax=Gossypium stocksii TaxID=47602 RepID=A0A9D3UQP6_9ROSI|nr:hypothetical protein J1N35_033715 [Gossypium stocksii]
MLMSTKEEYYKNLYVGGKFVCDPYVRYFGGEMQLWKAGDGNKGVEVAGSKGGEGVEGLNGDGVEVAGNKGGEGVEIVSNKCGNGGEVEGGEGLNGEGAEIAGNKGEEGVKVVGSQYGEGVEGLNGLDACIEGSEEGNGGLNSSVENASEEGVEDESDSDSKDENVYLIKVIGKAKETVPNEIESESFGEQFEVEVPEEVKGEGLNNKVGREEEGNETKYFDSDDHESILGSNDDENIDAYRRRNMFSTYNPNSASLHFCIRMMFKNAAFISAANSISGALRSAAQKAAKSNAAKFCGVYVNKTPLKVWTFSGVFPTNAAKGIEF